MFEKFEKIVAENLTDGGVMGGPTVIGAPQIYNSDSYSPGDARIPSSIFPKKKLLSRRGLSRQRRKRK